MFNAFITRKQRSTKPIKLSKTEDQKTGREDEKSGFHYPDICKRINNKLKLKIQGNFFLSTKTKTKTQQRQENSKTTVKKKTEGKITRRENGSGDGRDRGVPADERGSSVTDHHRCPQIGSPGVRTARRRRSHPRRRSARDLEHLPRVGGGRVARRPALRPRRSGSLVVTPLQDDVAAAAAVHPVDDLMVAALRLRRRRGGAEGDWGRE